MDIHYNTLFNLFNINVSLQMVVLLSISFSLSLIFFIYHVLT